MTSSISALAYIPEEADLTYLLGDWPRDVGLVLYLEANGSCTALPFCRGDEALIAAQLARLFGRPLDEIELFPAQPGQPEAQLLYSDEQKLISLIAAVDAEKILGPVSDFALNWQFACEEGIEDLAMLSEFRIPLAGPTALLPAPGPQDHLPAKVEENLPEAAPDRPAPPPGFLRLDPSDRDSCAALTGCLTADVNGTLLLRLDGISEAREVAEVQDVFVREDLQGLALDCSCEEPAQLGWRFPAEALPREMVPPQDGSQLVKLSKIGDRIFVSFVQSNATPTDPPPADDEPQKTKPTPDPFKRLGRFDALRQYALAQFRPASETAGPWARFGNRLLNYATCMALAAFVVTLAFA